MDLWSRRILFTLVTSCTALPGLAVAQVETPVSVAPTGGVAQWAHDLNDEAASARDREEAARRLIARKTDDTRSILMSALGNVASPEGQLAVARALSADPAPDSGYAPALFVLLDANRNVMQAAAQALGTFKDDPGVLERLSTEARNVSRSEARRIAVIRAMGAIPNKRAAQVLVQDLLMRDDQAAPIRDAAADALGDMTGLTEYERDLQRWGNWWQTVANLSDAAFKAELVNSRAARYDETRQKYNQLVDSLQKLLGAQYQSTAEAQKPDMMLRFLKSDQPVVRATGAGIIVDDAINGATTPSSNVRQQLRGMIGDSDPKVRLAVARAIKATNDPEALQPLLQQLVDEPQVDVREALVQAIAGINDVQAVPVLITRLNDPSNRVIEAAADALGTIGAPLRGKDPTNYTAIGQALLRTLQNRADDPAAVDVRAALARALARVPSIEMLGTFQRLLQRREPATVRLQAFRGLGALADKRAADMIVGALDDRDAGVRLEGVKALGVMATPVHAQTLLRLLDPASEPDASVRQWAWNAFLNVLNDPNADVDQLAQWDQRFVGEPARRVPILQAMIQRLIASKNERQLAFSRQTLGEVEEKLGRYDDAAADQRLALDYFLTQGMDQEALVATNGLMRALLRGKHYDDAAQFAADSIRRDARRQGDVGPALRQEAERLRQMNDLAGAVDLVDAVEKMKPPLADQYLLILRNLARELRPQLPHDAGSATTRTSSQSRAPAHGSFVPALGLVAPLH